MVSAGDRPCDRPVQTKAVMLKSVLTKGGLLLTTATNSDATRRSEPLNVLILLHWLRLDGSGIYYVRLAKALSKRGHKVLVASTGGALINELERVGIRHYCFSLLSLEYANVYARVFEIVGTRVPKYFAKHLAIKAGDEKSDKNGKVGPDWGGLSPRKMIRAVRFVLGVIAVLMRLTILIKKERIDVIEAHSTGAAALAFCCHRLLRIPYVVNVSAPRMAGLASSLFPGIAETAGSIVAISQECGDYLKKGFVRPRMVHIIHGVIDLKRFRRLGIEANRGYLRSLREQGFDIMTHTKKICIIGRLDEDKWNSIISTMLAMPIIRDDVGTAQLVVAGDGAMAGEARQLAAKINSDAGNAAVILIGHEERPERLMNICDVIVGVGTVVIEAMACERAVVVAGHRVGPQGGAFGGTVTPENVKDLADYYFTGRNAKQGTSAAMVAKECVPLLRDDKHRRELGRFGRRFVEEFCNIEQTVLKVEEIYWQIIGDGHHANIEIGESTAPRV